jgi:hypothetical protein
MLFQHNPVKLPVEAKPTSRTPLVITSDPGYTNREPVTFIKITWREYQ